MYVIIIMSENRDEKRLKKQESIKMKKTIIQCVTAVLCTALVGLSCSTGITKIADAKKQAAESAPAASSSAAADDSAAPADDGTVVPVDDGAVPADDGTVAPVDDGTAAPADDGTASAGDNTAAPAGSTDTKSGVPSTPAEIVNYYNTAMNKVISSKAGYTKKRTTVLGELEGAGPIMKIDVAKQAVYDFLGVGDLTYTNKKGEAKFLSKAALTTADVKDAKCTANGNIYTITLTLADGKSIANDSQKTDNASLKRTGLFVGSDDKSEYDYKSAVNIYMGLKNSEDTDITAVDETTSKTTVTLTVDSTTGKVTSYKASWHWDATLTGVKYLIVKINGIGHADSSVSISNFQW